MELAFNHIVFPAKLPGKQDDEKVIEYVEGELRRRFLDAIKDFKFASDDEAAPVWKCIETALNTYNLVNGGRSLDKSSLLQAFREVTLGNIIIVRVALQNASLIIRPCR